MSDDRNDDPFNGDGREELRRVLQEFIRIAGETTDAVIGESRDAYKTAEPHIKKAREEMQRAYDILKPVLDGNLSKIEDGVKRLEAQGKDVEQRVRAILRRFGLDK